MENEIADLKTQLAYLMEQLQAQTQANQASSSTKKEKAKQSEATEENDEEDAAWVNSKMKLPDTYDGRRPAVEVWLFQVQSYINASNIKNNEQAVYTATNLLRGDAATWWRYKYNQLTKDQEPLPNFKQFRELLTDKFQPVNAIQSARDQ